MAARRSPSRLRFARGSAKPNLRPRAALAVILLGTIAQVHPSEIWTPVRWNDEQAYELTTASWRAIVSVDRARLVHFGPADSDTSFVFAPPNLTDAGGWGGHRVWLGPQDTWRRFWPPPDAWEKSAAEEATVHGAALTLRMPPAGEGWPRLSRSYVLVDGQLACRVQVASDGTRDLQIMQILQTLRSGEIVVPIIASPNAPLGCLLLPPFARRTEIQPLGEPLPEFVSREGDTLRVRHSARLDKIAFPPQALVATYPGYHLRIGRGANRGQEVGAPDQGFYAQICPGADSMPVIELEQMSPLFAAGEVAESVMLVDLTRE